MIDMTWVNSRILDMQRVHVIPCAHLLRSVCNSIVGALLDWNMESAILLATKSFFDRTLALAKRSSWSRQAVAWHATSAPNPIMRRR